MFRHLVPHADLVFAIACFIIVITTVSAIVHYFIGARSRARFVLEAVGIVFAVFVVGLTEFDTPSGKLLVVAVFVLLLLPSFLTRLTARSDGR